MDFTKLGGLLDDAESWLHLEIDGRKLYLEKGAASFTPNKKPCRVKLRSVSSPEVVKHLKEIERLQIAHAARIQRAADKDIERIAAATQDKSEAIVTKVVAAAVADWENTSEPAEPVTPEAVQLLVNPDFADNDKTRQFVRLIRKQIYEHLTEQRSLFTDAG